MRRKVFLLVFSLCAALPALAFQQVTEGTFRVDFQRPDDLLLLDDIAEVHVIVLSGEDASSLSQIHLMKLRDWIARGGVMWAEGRGLESGVVEAFIPVENRSFSFRKNDGEGAGELIVKGALPQHVIHDHPLTRGVEQLYLYPQRDFTGTPKLQPLVEMTSPEGERGVILGAVPYGKGWIVLDGTARETRRAWWPFGRSKGFDEEHPNSVRLGERWNAYDWDRLLRSTAEAAQQTLASN